MYWLVLEFQDNIFVIVMQLDLCEKASPSWYWYWSFLFVERKPTSAAWTKNHANREVHLSLNVETDE